MNEKNWTVYLSGEIHSDWRERIAQGVAAAGLPVRLTAPVTVHADSDDQNSPSLPTLGVNSPRAEKAMFKHINFSDGL